MRPVSLTAASDPTREMPAHACDQLDQVTRTLDALAAEERRLQRLGFEIPLARCQNERRFWSFVAAVCTLAAEPESQRIGRSLPESR